MKKLHAAWIVLIVFCSSIVIGGIFYLFYRLYINHIYKRRRVWNEITSPMTKKTEEMREERVDVLAPRPSIIPLIQELLPNDWRRRTKRRKTVTQLQFSEPPVFEKNFINEWEEMDGRSTLFHSSFDRIIHFQFFRFTFFTNINVYSNIVLYNSRRIIDSRDHEIRWRIPVTIFFNVFDRSIDQSNCIDGIVLFDWR